MHLQEVLRRWQAGESRRAIARATGLSRNTVEKCLRAAEEVRQAAPEPLPEAEVLVRLARRSQPGPAAGGRAPQLARLAPYREQVTAWLQPERLQLTRVRELLGQQGLAVSYTSLRRFVQQAGLRAAAPTTVRMAGTAPGEVAELDFGRLGPLVEPRTQERHTVRALVVVLPFSRHCFVWPLGQQTLAAVIVGVEAAWQFFGGIPRRLIRDNFPAAVAGPDPLTPRPTRGFREYSQARGFLIDPARVRHPPDKPHVERAMPSVRERFWKGGHCTDLADARAQAARWCREVAGQRGHGTTRQAPLVVFLDQEPGQLRPPPDTPYDVPVWRTVTVHPAHHIAFQGALYSVPATICPPGTKLGVRGDRTLVRLYHRGALVRGHPPQPPGGRHTDPDDYPPERTAYAMRAPVRLIQQAASPGPPVGRFAERLLGGTVPWAKLRPGQKLLRLGERYTAARLDAACARALGFDLIDVRRVERILLLALEREGAPAPPEAQRLRDLPPGRFARPGHAFDHRHPTPEEAQP